MEKQDSYCPRVSYSDTTFKGTDLNTTKGKEDPVVLDSSLLRC